MRTYIVVALVSLAVGFATHATLFKQEPEVRTVVKEVKVRDTTAVTDIDTVTTKRPDGTVVTASKRRTVVQSETKSATDTKQEVSPAKPQWSVGIYAANQHTFIGTIDRRILGNLSVGVYTRFDGRSLEPGLGLRLEF